MKVPAIEKDSLKELRKQGSIAPNPRPTPKAKLSSIIPCRDYGPYTYMHIGNWDDAERAIRICMDANAYEKPDDGKTMLERLLKDIRHVACGDETVSLEKLPYPSVYYPAHYGVFIAFKPDIRCSHYIFCECARPALDTRLPFPPYGTLRSC